jgi:hypothetical protein
MSTNLTRIRVLNPGVLGESASRRPIWLLTDWMFANFRQKNNIGLHMCFNSLPILINLQSTGITNKLVNAVISKLWKHKPITTSRNKFRLEPD